MSFISDFIAILEISEPPVLSCKELVTPVSGLLDRSATLGYSRLHEISSLVP